MRNWLLLVAFVASSCNIPTDFPILEPRFLLPIDSTSMGVTQLTPAGITVRGDSFLIALEPVRFRQGIVELCGPSCRAVQGITAPKPAFTSTITLDVPFPADLNSVNGAGGSVTVTLSNNFTFDVLRPAANAFGSITLELSAGGVPIARDSIPGSETAFPPGSTLTRTLRITAREAAPPLVVTITIESPAGDPAAINASSTFDVTAEPQTLTAASVNVAVRERPVRAQGLALDLTQLDTRLNDNIKSGAMVLTIANPFPVSGTLTATFEGTGVNVARKSFPLVPGRSTQTVQFTVPELRSMIGSNVLVNVTGVVNAPDGRATVFPANVLAIKIDLDMTFITKDTRN